MTEQEVVDHIAHGALQFPPLTIKIKGKETRFCNRVADVMLELGWENTAYTFVAECRSRSTPKEFQAAIDQVLHISSAAGLFPMIVMPFLKERQILELAERQISGLDFSGNGVVVVPGQLFVFRTGSANQFPASETIQNVYRRNTAIVSRALLACPVFDSVNSIEAFIQLRGAGISEVSLSTVSKALRALEDDLIVARAYDQIRLVQPEKLLEKLSANFIPPIARRVRVGKSPQDIEALGKQLSVQASQQKIGLVGTGSGSVSQYAAMARENLLSVYCTNQHRLLSGTEFTETNRFPNLELIETIDKTVYFDSRTVNGFQWASPVQTYLELMAGDQRDKDTANQVKAFILADVNKQLTEK